MNKKRILGIIAIVAIIGFYFSACDNGTSHTHDFTGAWQKDATHHWKECAADSAVGQKAAHAPANGVCDTCGYDNSIMEMVSITPGTLTWGSATITLTAFQMGKYEVTQEQYQIVMGTNPSNFSSSPAGGETQGKRPVETVTWFDAIEFCNKLSEREGLTPVYTITGRTPGTGYPITAATVTPNWSNNGYRLPTEAQWEYACRAGATTNWHFGDTESALVNYAWYDANANSMTHEVGKKTANAFGLYDMHGNVWEWCWDWYGTLPSTNETDYKGAVSGSSRVRRGGSWLYSATDSRSAVRDYYSPRSRHNAFGFRVVRP
jgi:formylglycine-generating enzyme required for sulfatase activity